MELPGVDINHILYTTDFSENARLAYAYAKRIADQFQAKLTLLHVIQEEPQDLLVFDVGIDRAGSVPKRLSIEKAQLEKALEVVKNKVKAEYGCDDGDCDQIVVRKGNPVLMILRVAEEVNCDFIVMGIRGKGTLEGALMGDTVRHVVRRSSRPVLVMRNPEKP